VPKRRDVFHSCLRRGGRCVAATAGQALGAGRILVSWSRSNLDKIIRLCCTIEAPRARAGEALDVITAQLAGIIASIGLTVGVVGVVAGEEPVLTAFAPMRDLIAPRIRDALGGGTATCGGICG